VLVAFSSLLRRRLRHSDVLGRYGGEEFAVLLEGLDEPDALRVVEQLRKDFGALQHAASNGTRFSLTVSGGIACLDSAGMSFEAWKKAADDALYRAKAEGRDRVVVAPRAGSPPS
jgi:diguanylate cyclase (GGDEF)-like protein